MCQSGIAKIFNATTAMCVKIHEVLSNINNFASPMNTCDLSKEYPSPQGCRYRFKLQNNTFGTIAEDYCECSLNATMNEMNLGFCPFPG